MEKEIAQYLTRNGVGEIVEHVRRSCYDNESNLNNNSGYINLRNGVFDIEKKEITDHSAEMGFTYCLPFDYDKKAVPTKFLKFLKEITQEDTALTISILEGFAYCLMPGYPIQKANMLVGEGSNGKSTLMGVLTAFLCLRTLSMRRYKTITLRRGQA